MDTNQIPDVDLMLEYLQFLYRWEEDAKQKKDSVIRKSKTPWKIKEKSRKPNPLLIWEAINYCILEKKEFPDWVGEYLRNVSNVLLNIRNPGNRAAEMIKDALEFEDGTDFNRYIRAEEKRQIFIRVEEEIQKREGTDPTNEIFAQVAETFQRFMPSRGKNRYSEETIKKFYYEIKHIQSEDMGKTVFDGENAST
ncbi:MAG: hypothetical protein ABFD97_11325 [Syntrophobacter sp.]